VFHFWRKVGERMNLQDIPSDIDASMRLVDEYVDSDRYSRETRGGRALTEAITGLLVKYAFCFWVFISYSLWSLNGCVSAVSQLP